MIKYVNDFEFDAANGFTGSAQKPRASKRRKFADGGSTTPDDSGTEDVRMTSYGRDSQGNMAFQGGDYQGHDFPAEERDEAHYDKSGNLLGVTKGPRQIIQMKPISRAEFDKAKGGAVRGTKRPNY